MVGSSQSVADCNIVLNTMVADILQRIGDRLENCENIQEESRQIVREIIRDHGRIIFNGNNYSEEWREEAARRGLPNIPDSVQAAEALIKPKNMDLFMRHGVFSPKEMESRYEVMLESYAKTMNIEACTMLEMTRREIVPAAISYSRFLSETLNQIKDTGLAVDVTLEASLLKDVTAASAQLRQALGKLEKVVEKAADERDTRKKADLYRQQVLPAMDALRAQADRLETLLGKDYWPMPTYTELLYGNL